jgi:lipoprotein-anchoring transpeptidase ErfK/SrfK
VIRSGQIRRARDLFKRRKKARQDIRARQRAREFNIAASSSPAKTEPEHRRLVAIATQQEREIMKKMLLIHGTNDPDSIGRSASHGCVRLANWDVVRLATKIKSGDAVSIY